MILKNIFLLVLFLANSHSVLGSNCKTVSDKSSTTRIDITDFNPKFISNSDLRIDKKLNFLARAYLQKNGLIKSGEEISDHNLISKWGIVRTVKYGNINLLIMSPMLSYAGSQPEAQNSYEILVYLNNEIKLVEEVFIIPLELIVGFGEWRNVNANGDLVLPQDLYYVKLTGTSVLATVKALLTGFEYPGLSGSPTLKGGKESFDPTVNRKWRLINPLYDLRRGSTPEIHDVYAGQLDEDYKSYNNGSAGYIAPWSAAVRRVYLNNNWLNLIDKPVPID